MSGRLASMATNDRLVPPQRVHLVRTIRERTGTHAESPVRQKIKEGGAEDIRRTLQKRRKMYEETLEKNKEERLGQYGRFEQMRDVVLTSKRKGE
jgi:hypothetical protein